MRHSWLIAKLAIISTITAGCTPSPPPPLDSATAARESNSSSAATSASTVPAETATTTAPPQAQKSTAGAEEFTVYWFALINAAYQSGQVEALAPVTSKECAGCQGVIKDISTKTLAGERYQGLALTISNVVSAPLEGSRAFLSVRVEESPSVTLSSEGYVTETSSGAPVANFNFAAEWVDGHWIAVLLEESGGQ